eukprot:TRINITY_DN67467_c4_g5_i1.p1 TRINITY_DN67467_c4_g5~~TRINITY_DN67467_c4_g5_i1.p1  ORF type:complete len:571 (-),score=47.00 TRINITY_DN67467_c4_g5_i1:89-1705(-)
MKIFREVIEGLDHPPSMFSWFNSLVAKTKQTLTRIMSGKKHQAPLKKWHCDTSNPAKHCNLLPEQYFRFIPLYTTDVPLDGTKKTWSNECFKKNVAHMERQILGHRLVVQSSEPTSASCNDGYMIGNMEWWEITKPKANGTQTVEWHYDIPVSTSKPNEEWFHRNGIRILQFLDPEDDRGIEELLATLELFIGDAVAHLTKEDQDRYMNFEKAYLHAEYPLRNGKVIHLPESSVKDGTLLIIGRADGLTAFQTWGQGARAGHITMAMRVNGTLHVVESTDHTSYWPPHNIQMHKWDKWLSMAYSANFSVILLPLKDNYQKMFDANIAKARDFALKNLGNPYGYHNYLFGWMDKGNDNLPFPATFEMLEVVLSYFGNIDAKIATRMWLEALNFRLTGSWQSNMTLVEVANMGYKKGMSMADIWNIPEQDKWVYSDGPSMICDVFACKIYKTAGLFGALTDKIQCTEFQTSDSYQMDLYNPMEAKPAICKTEDPKLAHGWCQIEGDWTLQLRNASNVPLHANMFQTCGGHCPNFTRAPGC